MFGPSFLDVQSVFGHRREIVRNSRTGLGNPACGRGRHRPTPATLPRAVGSTFGARGASWRLRAGAGGGGEAAAKNID